MHIVGGRWRNAAGVEWGVAGPVKWNINYKTPLVGLPGVYQVFSVEKDCVYWKQNKCNALWAEGCQIYATSILRGQVQSFRFLSEVYYREGN